MLERALLGCSGDNGDVARDQPAPQRIGERTVDDEMDLVHGLRCKPDTGSGVQQRVVERFDLLAAEPPDAHLAECRKDVELHVAFVAAVGAGGEMQLLGWQPLPGEIGAECQRSYGVDSVGLGRGEFGGEAFSGAPVRSGRVPRSAFFAGDWIASLVDHRVVAVPSLSNVSLHDVLLQSAVPAIGTRRNNR